mgnify:CR=1 FL=1
MVRTVLLQSQVILLSVILDSSLAARASIHVDVDVHLISALDVPVGLTKVTRVVSSGAADLLAVSVQGVVQGVGCCEGLLEGEAQLDVGGRGGGDEEGEGLEVHFGGGGGCWC